MIILQDTPHQDFERLLKLYYTGKVILAPEEVTFKDLIVEIILKILDWQLYEISEFLGYNCI